MLRQLASTAAASAALLAAMPASSATFQFTASLTGAAEAPPNSSTALGLGVVTFDNVAFTVAVNEIFIGLTGGPATGSHIHCCTTTPLTGTAPVVVDFIGNGFPLTTSGAYNNTFNYSGNQAFFNTLLTGTQQGRAYLNIHNATYPGGEIRGFLIGVVPEPGTYALMLGGLAAVGLVARRRRSGTA